MVEIGPELQELKSNVLTKLLWIAFAISKLENSQSNFQSNSQSKFLIKRLLPFSIPRRDELVKQKRKAEKKDKDADLASKWRYCALSSEKLRKPIVSCPLGRLYNKEAIIEFLINKDDFKTNTVVSHIRNLKDVKELNFTEKKSAEPDSEQLTESNYICPVTALEMNGNYRFSYLKGCGCVISERALKEIKSDACLKCNRPFTSDGKWSFGILN